MIRRLLVASTLGVLSSALLVSVAIAGSITVPYPAEDPALQLTFSETGGTLSAAKLTEPRFSRDLRPAMEGVPVDQTDVGPIDLVTTWSDNFYPLRLLFNHLSVAGVAEIQIGAVERASIDGTLLTPEEGPKAPSPAAGDLIRVKAPANLAGDYTVSGVMDSGAVALTSTTGLNNAKSSEVSYTIHRRGEVGTLYAQGPKFKRIGSGDQLPFTFVWPNPETDKSPLYIERRFEPGKHEYEIAMKVAIHNVSPAEVKAQIGIDVTGWQHPALAEMSMFMAPPDLYAASCLTGDSYEREDYTELWECSDGGGCTEQPVSFTTPTEWVGIETRYMLLGVVAESLTGAQCRLTASPTAPTIATIAVGGDGTQVPDGDEIVPRGASRADVCRDRARLSRAAEEPQNCARPWATPPSSSTRAIVFAPIEYIQPRIGWVYYRKCAVRRLSPMSAIWIVHSLWDGLILTGLLVLVWLLVGPRAFKARARAALCIMAAGGMLQELFLETHQCLWYYPPNRWNPVWAVIGGHPMTLQQWHWAVIPPLFYIWMLPDEPRSSLT